MMHGCTGAYSYSDPSQEIAYLYREWGDRLVRAGYVALLVDSFTPRNAAQNRCGLGNSGVSEVYDRPYDAYAGLNYLASQPFVSADKIGLLGWSHGGSSAMTAVEAATFGSFFPFKAAVAFYPGCGLYNAFGGLANSVWKPYAPFLILHGSADTAVSVDYCFIRVSRAQALGATNASIAIFANAQHNFDTPNAAGRTQSDIDAKLAADAQAIEFFLANLR